MWALLFMESQSIEITHNAFVRDAQRLLKEGNMPNKKVYKEVRMYLQQYADSQNKFAHITVPYWTHKLSPEVLATMLRMWCSMIDESKPRGA